MEKEVKNIDYQALLKRALVKIEDLQRRLDQPQMLINERIAIVGMGCRLPGGIIGPEAFWQFLQSGGDAVTEFPPDRWQVDDFYDPDPAKPGKTYVRHGAFLEHIDRFDPELFGIAPREANSMDPQQRLLLEVTWEALENAGQNPMALAGSRTGVFIGISSNDYSLLQTTGDLASIDTYFGVGVAHSIASGRLSYVLGLEGPSVSLDTACSSSLLATHLACQSLRMRESDMALAGGVNLILALDATITASKASMLSRQGRCKTFDASADGYVRGEGCGMVVLKRLSDAIAHNDPIIGVIRGTAANHDGHSNGLTAPSARSQERVIRRALENAGMAPEQVDYIEAHGTATNLGDPIEMQALGEVFKTTHGQDHPLMLGSVKTNIGHLESAAGVTSLIKVALALQHKEIPPHLHLKTLNPLVPWQDLPFRICTERSSWPKNGPARIAGVSSFGFSGTNVHMIVEEAADLPPKAAEAERPSHILTLSATDEEALQTMVEQYARLRDETLADACYTANTGRRAFSQRLAVVADNADALREKLAASAAGQSMPGVERGACPDDTPPEIVFLFTGQGSQYRDMGRELYETQPVFRRVLDECDAILKAHLTPSLLSVIFPSAENAALLDQTAYTQPALFALEYALCRLWQAWGISPSVLMGHSVGEYVAACVAGLFSLEDGLKLIAARGRLIQQLPLNGAMTAVFADEQTVRRVAGEHLDRIALAAVNGPRNTVISGEISEVQVAGSLFEAEGIKTHPLTVSHAFHSRLMEPVMDEFETVARSIRYSRIQIPLISNVTGKFFGNDDLPDAGYWRTHMRQAVRFADGVRAVADAGYATFLEVGPKPTLLGLVQQTLPDRPVQLHPTLSMGKSNWQQMLTTLGRLYVSGLNPDWEAFDRDYPRRRVALPTYPFKRRRCWVPAATQGAVLRRTAARRSTDRSVQDRPLLGRRLTSASNDIQYEHIFSADWPAFLKDHKVYDKIIVPGACHIALALAAARDVLGEGACEIIDAAFPAPLVLDDGDQRTVHLVLTPDGPRELTFRLSSLQPDARQGQGAWSLHASGRIRSAHIERDKLIQNTASLDQARSRCQEQIPLAQAHYQRAAQLGLQLGSSFKWIGPTWRAGQEALALMQPSDPSVAETTDPIHPGLLDSCFQLLGGTVPAELDPADDLYVPVGFARLLFCTPPGRDTWCRALMKSDLNQKSETLTADLQLFDSQGEIIALIQDLYLKRAPREALMRTLQEDIDRLLYRIQWKPDQAEASAPFDAPGRPADAGWLIFADQGDLGHRLAGLLTEKGLTNNLVYPGKAFSSAPEGHYQINPNDPEDFRRLWRELADSEMPAVSRVVYLWGTDFDAAEPEDPARPHAMQSLVSGGALALIQALSELQDESLPRLWLVTRGVHAVASPAAKVSVNQAPLWGLGRVMALEYPHLWGGLADLSGDVQQTELAMLLQEISGPGQSAQVVFSSGMRYEARLTPLQLVDPHPQEPGLESNKTYLITGGLGGLGLQVARWMAENGAGNLVLVSRREPSPRASEALDQLRQMGAGVLVINGDVADATDVERIVNEITDKLPPLKGIIHAAGLLDDGILAQQSWPRFDKVMAAKISGAWHLHHATRDADLDFFVLFSSMAAVLGSAGQANYAAANAYLDTLAGYRRSLGLPALSIAWGAWSQVGMAAELENQKQDMIAALGVTPLSATQGLQVLERLIAEGSASSDALGPHVGVIGADWHKLRRNEPALGGMPLLQDLTAQASPGPREPSPEDDAIRERLSQLSPSEGQDALHAWLGTQVARLLGFEPGALNNEKSIINLGFDSLMAVQLKNTIESSLGISIAVARILEGPSVVQLNEWIYPMIDKQSENASETKKAEDAGAMEPLAAVADLDPEKARQLLDQLDELSDDQVAQMLRQLGPQAGEGDV